MAKLRITTGPMAGRTIDLNTPNSSIGRDLDNTLRLAVAEVSRHHAVLIQDGDGFTLRDLASTNGTYVNGARVSETIIRHGDRIRFGSVEAGFECEANVAPQPGPTKTKTGLVSPVPVPPPAAGPAAGPKPGGAAVARPQLPSGEVRIQQPLRTAPTQTTLRPLPAAAPKPPADTIQPPPVPSASPAKPAVERPSRAPEIRVQPPQPVLPSKSQGGATPGAVPSQPSKNWPAASPAVTANPPPSRPPAVPEPIIRKPAAVAEVPSGSANGSSAAAIEQRPASPSPAPIDMSLKKPVRSFGEDIQLHGGTLTLQKPRAASSTETKPGIEPVARMQSMDGNRRGPAGETNQIILPAPASAPGPMREFGAGSVATASLVERAPSRPENVPAPPSPAPKVEPRSVSIPLPSPKESVPVPAVGKRWIISYAVLLLGGVGGFVAGYPLNVNALKFFGLLAAATGFWGLALAPWYARHRRKA